MRSTLALALLLLASVGCSSDDDVRYWVELGFDFDPPVAEAEGRAIRVNVCRDRSGARCSEIDLDPLDLATAENSMERYLIPLAANDNRLTLVARDSSEVGGIIFFRAWVRDEGVCCPISCSPGFLDSRGDLADATLSDSAAVPVLVPMGECPGYVTCPAVGGDSACACSCDVAAVIADDASGP